MNKRARVNKVTVGLRYPGGITEIHHINGHEADAILNSDRGVTEILAPFYKNTERYLKTENLISAFGPGVTTLTGQGEEVPITPQLVKDLWNYKGEEGLSMPFFIKIPDCYLGFPKLRSKSSRPQTDSSRPQINGVQFQFIYPDGKVRELSLKEGSFEGLFWSDRTVLEILAPFYGTVERRLSRTQMEDLFGPGVISIIGNQPEIMLTPEVVAELWNLEDTEGLLPPVMIKIPDCILEIPKLQATDEYVSIRKTA